MRPRTERRHLFVNTHTACSYMTTEIRKTCVERMQVNDTLVSVWCIGYIDLRPYYIYRPEDRRVLDTLFCLDAIVTDNTMLWIYLLIDTY